MNDSPKKQVFEGMYTFQPGVPYKFPFGATLDYLRPLLDGKPLAITRIDLPDPEEPWHELVTLFDRRTLLSVDDLLPHLDRIRDSWIVLHIVISVINPP